MADSDLRPYSLTLVRPLTTQYCVLSLAFHIEGLAFVKAGGNVDYTEC